jgi:hypothetical protein
MNRPALVIALAGSCLTLAACSGESGEAAGANTMPAAGDDDAAAALDWTSLNDGAGTAAGALDPGFAEPPPAAANSGGAALPQVGEIVVENGVRYRAGPNDARVRVDENGAEITVDTPDPDMPKVDGEL